MSRALAQLGSHTNLEILVILSVCEKFLPKVRFQKRQEIFAKSGVFWIR